MTQYGDDVYVYLDYKSRRYYFYMEAVTFSTIESAFKVAIMKNNTRDLMLISDVVVNLDRPVYDKNRYNGSYDTRPTMLAKLLSAKELKIVHLKLRGEENEN